MRIVCVILAAAALLSGYTRSPSRVERYVPTTDAERAATVDTVKALLAATPASLSVYDRDWDWDGAIAEVRRIAAET